MQVASDRVAILGVDSKINSARAEAETISVVTVGAEV
jgi:hypothetical protein